MSGRKQIENNLSLREQAQELRANAIRLRLQSAAVFCDVAENELRWQLRARAELSLGKVRRALAEIRRHLSEKHHVTAEAGAELSCLLLQVEAKAKILETRLKDCAN